MRKVKFHVEHNVTPKSISTILPLFNPNVPLSSEEVYTMLPSSLWFSSKYEIKRNYLNKNLDILSILGVLSNKDKHYKITSLGEKLQYYLQFDSNIFFDLMHYLYYSMFEVQKPESYFSWTYRNVCEILWEIKPSSIEKNKLASEVYNYARGSFPDIAYDIALSPYAIHGVVNWLKALKPPFIILDGRRNMTNNGRSYCSVELFILAINFLYQEESVSVGTPIIVGKDKETFLAKFCLLDSKSVKNVLGLTLRVFSDVLKEHRSVWGNSIILSQKIEPLEVLR